MGLWNDLLGIDGHDPGSPSTPEAAAGGDGSYQVPASTTWSQLLDYVHGSGDAWPFDLYGVGVAQVGRNQAISYAALHRCVTLLSSLSAQVITNGRLRVVDRQGNTMRGPRIMRILDLLNESPDGDENAYTWVEDWAADYLLDGNGLAVVSRSTRGPTMMRRMSPWDAETIRPSTGHGGRVYRVRDANLDLLGEYEYHDLRNVVHARWPRLARSSAVTSGLQRHHFATAPVRAMRPALRIGRQADEYVHEWFQSESTGASLGISTPRPIPEEVREQFIRAVRNRRSRRDPLIFGHGVQFTPLGNQSAATEQLTKLREYQVQEIGRVYGVPAPALGQNLTSWGSGIEQLLKALWAWGGKLHTERLLRALKHRLLMPGELFAIDSTELIAGDSNAVGSLVQVLGGDAQRSPLATTEEMRHLIGLPKEPSGTMPRPPMAEGDAGDDDGQDAEDPADAGSGARRP